MSCALALLEANHVEVHAMGHHRDVLDYLITVLKLKGETAAAVKVLILTRNASRYDGATLANERMVMSAIKWAGNILAETEQWFVVNNPNVLKRLDASK